MPNYTPIEHTVEIDMELVENFLKSKPEILWMLAGKLPESVSIDVEFDHHEGKLQRCCDDTHTLAYVKMDELCTEDILSLYPEHEERIKNTIYCTIYSKLLHYETVDGLEQVAAELRELAIEVEVDSLI